MIGKNVLKDKILDLTALTLLATCRSFSSFAQPAFFMDESNIMDYAESSRLKYSWYDIPSYILYATVISGVFGGIILVISVRVIKLTNKAEIIFKQRIYID